MIFHKHQLHVRIIDKKLTAVSREALLQSVSRHENGIIFRFTMKPRHHLNQMEDMFYAGFQADLPESDE